MAVPQRVRIAEQLVRRIQWEDIDRAAMRRLVECARDEAFGGRAVAPQRAELFATSRGPSAGTGVVDFVAASDTFTVCGLGLAPVVIKALGVRGELHARTGDGATVLRGAVLATLHGQVDPLPVAAAVLCAFLGRLCGIATCVRRHVDALGDSRTRLLDSGATTPGWLTLEKYAMGCGGAWDGGWADRPPIDASGRGADDLAAAVRRARETLPETPVEVLVREAAAIDGALAAGPDIIGFEGFNPAAIQEAVARVNGRVFTRAQAGSSPASLRRHAGLGLDFVSIDGLVGRARWAGIHAACRR